MLSKVVLFLAIVAVASKKSVSSSGYTFPKDFKSCNATSNSSCLVDLLQDALTKLGTKGISSPIDFSLTPMIVSYWTFHFDVGAVQNEGNFWNMSHPSLWNATVKSASFNSTSLTLKYTTYLPEYSLYASDCRIWGILNYDNDSTPGYVEGSGKVDKHIYDVTMDHTITFFTASINSTDYYFIKTYDLSVTNFTGAMFNYENLYNGDAVMAKKGGDLMNEYAAEIIRNQATELAAMIVSMFKLYTQRLISSVPASEILAHLAG